MGFFSFFFLNLQRKSLGSSLADIAAGPCSHGLAEGSWEYHVHTPCSQHECCSSIVFCIPL